jgi:hypothetical protein
VQSLKMSVNRAFAFDHRSVYPIKTLPTQRRPLILESPLVQQAPLPASRKPNR